MELFYILYIVLSVFCWVYASKLNRSGIAYFLVSLIISPVLVLLFLFIIGDRYLYVDKRI